MKTHGLSSTPTYRSWSAMKARCDGSSGEKNRKNYADRGITVCDRWRCFENFLADMGERPAGMTLDRIDPLGNYEPRNCRWADLSTQNKNKRPDGRHNQRDKTHCPKGHPYAGSNLIVMKTGERRCKECARLNSLAWDRARDAARAEMLAALSPQEYHAVRSAITRKGWETRRRRSEPDA